MKADGATQHDDLKCDWMRISFLLPASSQRWDMFPFSWLRFFSSTWTLWLDKKHQRKMHFWEITFQSQQKTFNQWQPWGKVHLHFSVNTHRHSPHGRQNEQTFLQLRFWRIECFVLDEHRTTSQGQIIWINFDSNKRSFLWQVNWMRE